MATYAPYHNPTDFGTFDLGTNQTGKTFQFDWDTDVIAEAKAVAVFRRAAIKTYTVGDGIAISNANRRITITLDGADFEGYEGSIITFQCSFFVEGDVEVTFKVEIIKTHI